MGAAKSYRAVLAKLPTCLSVVLRFTRHHLRDHPAYSSSRLEQSTMVVTVYETQTPDGWTGTGVLTTLERATITQVVQQTATATEGDGALALSTVSSGTSIDGTTTLPTAIMASTASAESSSSIMSSSGSIASSSDSTFDQSPSTRDSSSTAQLSTGSIVGIAVGCIAAIVLLITFLLFGFGFRVRRAKLHPGITEPKEGQGAVDGVPGVQGGKAELEDAEYTRRLERLHEGAKPELDGSGPRRTGWKAFSIRSLKRGSRPGAAELDAGTGTQGPHELPA